MKKKSFHFHGKTKKSIQLNVSKKKMLSMKRRSKQDCSTPIS